MSKSKSSKSNKSSKEVVKAAPAAHPIVAAYHKHCLTEFSETYALGILRPLNAFGEWLDARKLGVKALTDKHLERYAAHVVSQGRAVSTNRMELARVQTFLRWSGCKADLSALRLRHTKKEKQHLAELAAARASA